MFADLGAWLSRVIGGGLIQTGLLLFCIALPFALLTILLHWLERRIQQPLVRRFGWRSVLWTGWLGTPIHELSHVVLCKIFAHRVDEVALFRPDRQAGRLGFVRHSFNRRNYFQVVGNFFIGIAPLAGGSIVLFVLLWLLYPDVARQAIDVRGLNEAMADGQLIDSVRIFLEFGFSILSRIATVENLTTWRLWLFLYLALCVGSHTAPSRDDYRGALRGGLLVLCFLFLANVVLLIFGSDGGGLVSVLAPMCGPALGMLALCAILCSFVALLIFLASAVFDLTFGPRRG